ncbi:DUF1361 domain-containing protein [Loigolactobacillus zhaoyuanensis]|uniref:DUF1361 domain-containing protein n=1 Tax=Loigolactobacillus zhaoyuanensis TaxID=2486017 RepID=A0ABW8UBK6_9LACO|nr:DUF1361 domain-containing protein [Loigolactobacillus zhaoyuanensis]
MVQRYRWLVRGAFLLFFLYLYLFAVEPFRFILLNTFLGYIPIEIALHYDQNKPQPAIFFWILVVLWLLFYPNAPYLLTDLFHLSMLDPYDPATGLIRFSLRMWLAYTNLTLATLSCTILGFWSMEHTIQAVIVRLHLTDTFWLKAGLVVLITFLTSVGIFIGRFLRLHSIYIILEPTKFIKPLLEMWDPRMLIFVFLMTLIQLVIYVCLQLFKHTTPNAEQLEKKQSTQE